jgi:sodium/bile acid cotransporter 7
MRDFLARRWFLLGLVGGVAVALVRPDWLRPWFGPLDPLYLVPAALFLTAWGLERRNLLDAVRRPWAALWATAISYGLVPALAWAAGHALPDADFRIGLLIMASVPCTLASAVIWTRRAGGSEATALLVVLLTTSTSWLFTTAWLTAMTGVEAHVDAPALMRLLLLALLAPVAAGQLVRAAPPLAAFVARRRRLLGVVAQLLVLAVILKASVGVGEQLAGSGPRPAPGLILLTIVLCLGVHLAAWAAGFWSSGWLRFGRPAQAAVGFACSQKTLPVALVVYAYFAREHPLAVFPLVVYHFGQLFVDTLIADRLAGRSVEPQTAPVEV